MSYFSNSISHSILVILLFVISITLVQAQVPANATFKYTNEGEFGDYITEYDAYYRTLGIGTFPYVLCFYNTTPNAFLLGLRMGHRRSESAMKWVWDANRGKPVRENATLTFGTDGNLVLADVDGTVVWQTDTANKGVVGLKLLPTGNLVLHDSKGKFIWQSFDYPTDTLFVGQSLRIDGPNKLVSRLSALEPVDGPYTYVLENKTIAMYYKSINAKNPIRYYDTDFGKFESTFTNVTFKIFPFTTIESDTVWAYEFELEFKILNRPLYGFSQSLSRPKYNTTYSILRMDVDGNVRIYTYEPHVDYLGWETTYTRFGRDRGEERSECKLPKRCGAFGACEDNQCVACPTPSGLLGWSKSCAPPVLPPCGKRANVDYFKVVGVEHFTNGVTEGSASTTLGDCRQKCDSDCKCLGYFYREESSKCLLAPDLGALNKVDNSSHVAYIKYSK